MEDKNLLEPAEMYRFCLDGTPVKSEGYGKGHINTTYLIETDKGIRYIFQRISNAFDVNILMKNVSAVLDFIEKNSKSDRVMRLIKTRDGKDFLSERSGNYRVFNFVENTVCLQKPECADDFYQCGVGFGEFQKLLEDFPAETLGEPLKNFHNTVDRYRLLKEAISNDAAGRAKSVTAEIDFALSMEKEGGILQGMRERGELPLRVTHNDTKMNNVLLDEVTHKSVCVIDLDTVMPGLACYDFGDAIRFGASTAEEDEKDLSKVTIDLDMYRAFLKGFTESCDLTKREKETLPLGAVTMTLECGVRFLTDYLNGDTYFKTEYKEQNLDRCRTQFKLVREMKEKFEQMKI